MAFLNYSLKNYRRAAVLGSFVAFHYPDSVAAKDCANVALAARQRLYQMSNEADRELQADAIGNVAVMVAASGVWASQTAWPDLIVAGIMAGLFLWSATQIILQALQERQHALSH